MSTQPAVKDSIHRRLAHYLPATDTKGLAFILSPLNTRIGCLLMTSSATPFHAQDLSTRTLIVASWSASRIPLLRALFRSFSGLAKQTWLETSQRLPKVIDFPSTPKHIERNDPFEFAFKHFPAEQSLPITINTDVVIVGSGCGAGVAALHLSTAGYKVVVVDKSYHFPSTHFPMDRSSSGIHLFENGGTTLTDDASVGILAGSTWGGGGTVNWSASLQPQHFVREEWAKEGLPHFTSSEFQDCLDTVCRHMAVCKADDHDALAKIDQNFANCTLLEGARRLGYMGETVPQNTGGKKHYCSYCGEGCGSATKQGPANYWLPQAAAKGAEFIEGCWIAEIVIEDSSNDSWIDSIYLFSETPQKSLKATSVRGTWTSRDRLTTVPITITASRVIVAGGTLNSPLLLTRSGLTNPNIGQHLHLHPTLALSAVWPQRVNPWEGPILTAAITSLENLDGAHHAASDFKRACAKFGHMTNFISLQRDRDTGRVYADPNDPTRRRVRVAYTPSARDLHGVLAGVLALARIVYTMGCIEIVPFHPHIPVFRRDPAASTTTNDTAFDAWLSHMQSVGLTSPDPCILGSAHQMGTCRMSTSRKTGVVDDRGRVFGTSNVYVADASVFPSASGVNPMITTMGISEWICRRMVDDDSTEKNKWSTK